MRLGNERDRRKLLINDHFKRQIQAPLSGQSARPDSGASGWIGGVRQVHLMDLLDLVG